MASQTPTQHPWDDDERAPPSWHPAHGDSAASPACVARDVLRELERARMALAWDTSNVVFREYGVEPPDRADASPDEGDANADGEWDAVEDASVEDAVADDAADNPPEVNGDLVNDRRGYAYI